MYTRSTFLRRAEPRDAQFLRDLELLPGSATAWRFAGYRPTVEEYRHELGSYLRADVVSLRSSGSRIGLVGLKSANPMSGIAYLTMLSDPSTTGHLRMLEAVGAFVLAAYESPGIRKIYAEVPGFTWPGFSRGEGRYFRQEGLLVDYVTTADGFSDLHVIAFDRTQWSAMETSLRSRIGLER